MSTILLRTALSAVRAGTVPPGPLWPPGEGAHACPTCGGAGYWLLDGPDERTGSEQVCDCRAVVRQSITTRSTGGGVR